MAARAFIAGCAGVALTADEAAFFQDAQPWGLIVFRRNVESRDQLRALTDAFRDAVGRTDAPVLVDQEGGRVQRLAAPHWPVYPSARRLSSVHANDPLAARELVRITATLMARDLREVGITVDCLPVLDVPAPGSHGIIGDRAYADDPSAIAVLGRAAAEGLMAGCVLPVMKHMPGHGRARADSHEALPVVDAPLEALRARDFAPFAMLADMPLAMTAHVVFTAIDPDRPATTSPEVFARIIRGELGYDGLVMSDDLSMKALSGSFRERAEATLAAGCDVVLHCNGAMEEMRAVAEAAPELSEVTLRRVGAAMGRINHRPEPLDVVEARARLDAALAVAA